MDLVWNRYLAESLKNCTREKYGVGVLRKVTGHYLIPTNLITFLRCSENKAWLFPYLSNVVVKEMQDKVVVSTVNENVVINGAGIEIWSLMSCNMEEADERVFVHVKYALREHARIMINTVDSDVVVIAIANFYQLVPLNELWVEFGA